ncbi:Mob1/phocein [Catenaria anguillulae PL171]|uniref:Mob1/phocein n=1 Tax=Catenaria anguillulae PL171 TaxID=765915 RepID=A0A1Y2HIK3_9FUNG|nr:Mob1/phocein [Catenaria anguillulae PL171]
MSFFNIRSKIKSARKTSASVPKPLFVCQPYVTSVLVKGSFQPMVALPAQLDRDEWLAANVFDFFHYISLFSGTIAEFCTSKECTCMSAGSGVEYAWVDAQKRSSKVSAPQYIDSATTWLQRVLDDPEVFPTKSGIPPATVKQAFKHMFRILAHIYHAHYDKILHLHAEAHLNTLFAHFICFAKEFDLLDKKELEPVKDLVAEFEAQNLC